MSYTKVTFCGLNLTRLICKLCKSGIVLLSVTKCGQSCSITVNYRDKKRLLQLLEEGCYKVTDVQNFGMVAHFEFAKQHIVLIVALVLMVAVCMVLPSYCCKIVVTGDLSSDVVTAQMQELGITVGANIAKLNIDHLENALATRLDVMYAVVTRKGSVLYVDTIAKKQIDAPIDMHKRRDIVSTCDGIVQSL
ncbi:MAG: sporulation protein YqfD, partial [Clostridia bacterium]|nr:sporulation protein YqfD [Clostridia bacterium]